MIDFDKFICSLMATYQRGFNSQYLVLKSALEAQGFEYKDGKIVKITPEPQESEYKGSREEQKIMAATNYVKERGYSTGQLDVAYIEGIEWADDHPNWKPSEMQMKALDIAIRCGIKLGTWEEAALRELVEQLKKL